MQGRFDSRVGAGIIHAGRNGACRAGLLSPDTPAVLRRVESRTMTSPQSATPSSRRVVSSARRFTLEEANSTLPLVRRVVKDIVASHERAAQLQAEALTGLAKPEVHAELRGLLQRLQEYTAELGEIGCDLKDPAIGLVDFVASHDGRDVCLCWKLDEPAIAHWHEVAAGYAGRQPIASLTRR